MQYLAGSWSPDWSTLLHSPLGLTREKVWKQLLKRPEFSDYKADPKQLSHHDAIVVQKMTEMFTQEEEIRNTLTSVSSCQKANSASIPYSKPKTRSKDAAKGKEIHGKPQNVNENFREYLVQKLDENYFPTPVHTDNNSVEDSQSKSQRKSEIGEGEEQKSEKGSDREKDQRVSDSSKNGAFKSASEAHSENMSTVPKVEIPAFVSKKSTKENSSKTNKAKNS